MPSPFVPTNRFLTTRAGRVQSAAFIGSTRGQVAAGAGIRATRLIWKGKTVMRSIVATMEQRMLMATKLLQAKVRSNISVPVGLRPGVHPSQGGKPRSVGVRSKPGQYPRQETGLLIKSIYREQSMIVPGLVVEGRVGTTLFYGFILETRMNRKMLVATLFQQSRNIANMFTGPIRVGSEVFFGVATGKAVAGFSSTGPGEISQVSFPDLSNF